MRKKAVKIVGIIMSVISLAMIMVGIVYYYRSLNKIKGACFRQTYGSIGVLGDSENILRFTFFCFGYEPEFIKENINFSFDNTNVSVEGISSSVQFSEKDLTVYNIDIRTKVNSPGQHRVTKLITTGPNENKSYDMGKIDFVRIDGKPVDSIRYGCCTALIDNEACYDFSCENPYLFTIEDVVVARNEWASFTYEKGISTNAEEDIQYFIGVHSEINDEDLFLLQPIFVLSFEKSEDYYLLETRMAVYSGKDLSYSEVKEYVKCLL